MSAAQRRRPVSIARDDDVGGHDRLHAGRDRGAERRELDLRSASRDVATVGRLEMRVDLGGAVPREVLRTRGDPGGLQALDERGDVPGDELRVARRTSGRRSRG